MTGGEKRGEGEASNRSLPRNLSSLLSCGAADWLPLLSSVLLSSLQNKHCRYQPASTRSPTATPLLSITRRRCYAASATCTPLLSSSACDATPLDQRVSPSSPPCSLPLPRCCPRAAHVTAHMLATAVIVTPLPGSSVCHARTSAIEQSNVRRNVCARRWPPCCGSWPACALTACRLAQRSAVQCEHRYTIDQAQHHLHAAASEQHAFYAKRRAPRIHGQPYRAVLRTACTTSTC